MNKLSNRLQAIYDLILPCETLLEIGCDHCWLSIFLVKNQKIKKAIASDINQEPLESCKLNIQNTGELNIDTKISDGFLSIKQPFDAVVISGIGAKLMCDILSQRDNLYNKKLILQPQKNEYILRRYLKEKGFNILDEVLVQDNSFTYSIISVVQNGHKIIDDQDIFIGPVLKQDKSELHINKINERIKHLAGFVDKIIDEREKGEVSKELETLKEFVDKSWKQKIL